MLRSVIGSTAWRRAAPSLVLVLAASLSACTTASVRSQEGHACSTSSSDDPQLVCSPSLDLICISTYTRTITNPTEAAKFDGGVRHVYVCRLACNNSEECPEEGDVCCKGDIYDKTYNKMGGCTPPSSCYGTIFAGDGGSDESDAGAADGAADMGQAAPDGGVSSGG